MSNDLLELVRECGVAEEAFEKAADALALANRLKFLGLDKAAEKLMAEAMVKAKLGKLAGFRYVRITPEKIQGFLDRAAEDYNKKQRGPEVNRSAFQRAFLRQRSLTQTTLLSYVSPPILSVNNNAWQQQNAYQGMLNQVDLSLLNQIYDSSIYSLGQAAAYSPPEMFTSKTIHAASFDKDQIGQFVWTEVPLKNYAGVPPTDVLKALEEHQGRSLFDGFTVASVNAIPDPLLLGRIEGSTDRYFIAQWGKDISLDEII